MSYDVHVLADSISEDGHRLTTLLAVFPRFILAELNTHRMLSRNSASSRAIPTAKLIQRTLEAPFVPETFNHRVKGMGVGEALVGLDASAAEEIWLTARDNAVGAAEGLLGKDCDKSRANRLLEPFLWHTAIVSATEWDNFLALRDHPDAQPEFQILARMIREALEASEPRLLYANEWHLPLVSEDEWTNVRAHGNFARLKLVSAGRCARVSFDTQDRLERQAESVRRAETLMGNGHFSPFEHVARPWGPEEVARYAVRRAQEFARARVVGEPTDDRYLEAIAFSANFRGWVQMRREIPDEARFDRIRAELAQAA